MKDTKPVTKEALIAVIASTLAEFCPESDDSSYEPIVKFAAELQAQLEKL